jgi:hypothetical protein
LPDQWKESIIVPVNKNGDKTDCSNYHGISLLSTSYKNFIQYSSLNVKSIHRRNYWGSSVCVSTNRSTPDQIYFIHHILEKKLEYNATVHQLFIDLKKSCDLLRRKILYNILIEYGAPMKLVWLIAMYCHVSW